MSEQGQAPQILVTGRHWLGAAGACSIGNALVDLIAEAKQEVIIVAYRLTVSVGEFTGVLESALGRGCLVRIIRDNSGDLNSAEEAYIERLTAQFQKLSVWDFKDGTANHKGVSLHAKMIVVDRKWAIVGSANFSRNGMVENHELALRLSGPEVRDLGKVCDHLIESGRKDGTLVLRRRDGT